MWESMDILKSLDEAFPDTESVFTGTEVEAEMMQACETLLSSSFKYSYSARNASLSLEEKAERKAGFEAQLSAIDTALTSHGGPFMTGKKPAVADLMIIPMLERYRYQLPLLAGKDSPKVYGGDYPALTSWFDAMDELPAYMNRCAGDAYSWTAVTSTFLRLFSANSTSEVDLQGPSLPPTHSKSKLLCSKERNAKNKNDILPIFPFTFAQAPAAPLPRCPAAPLIHSPAHPLTRVPLSPHPVPRVI